MIYDRAPVKSCKQIPINIGSCFRCKGGKHKGGCLWIYNFHEKSDTGYLNMICFDDMEINLEICKPVVRTTYACAQINKICE